jgi:hypothetical protein
MYRIPQRLYSLFVVVVLASALLSARGFGQSVVIGSGVQGWVDAARTGRADMLVLGDSVVWAGGAGWDAGLNRGFSNRLGLAGTGLQVNSELSGEGEGFGSYGDWYGFSNDPNAIPAAQRHLTWRGAVTAPSTPIFGFGWGVEANHPTLESYAAYDWNLYTLQGADGGTLGARRRLDGWNIVQPAPAVALPPSTDQLTRTSFHFDAVDPSTVTSTEFQVDNTAKASIAYSRLVKTGASGVTVTSWGYGGHNTRQFLQDFWLGSQWDAAGRQALLNNLVDGGSGKLNVLIAEGFNDRNDMVPSYHGVAAGQTAEGYQDNTLSLINAIRSDWSALGRDPSSLSFTLLGMYQTDDNNSLRVLADRARLIAQSDAQISFIDLFQLAPTFAESLQRGYLRTDDPVHPNYDGSIAFGDAVVAALLPPASSSWNVDANGNWNTSSNWQGGTVPRGGGAAATFGASITAPRLIAVDSLHTVSMITFSSAQSYTIAGPATITLDVSSGSAAINVTAGAHTIAAPFYFADDTTITTAAGSGVALAGVIDAAGKVVTKAGAGTAAFANLRAAALNVTAGSAILTAKASANHPSGTSVVQALTIAAGASLDLTNNSAVIDYAFTAPLGAVRDMLHDGRLFSSSADANHRIGYADNDQIARTIFGGLQVDATSVLIKYTYAGDANLDGQVDVTDLGALASNWQTSNVWTGGDFNYDGFVDVTDLGALATNWQAGVGSPLAPSRLDDAMQAVGLSPIGIPEPSALALFGSVTALVFPRRRS